MNVFNINGIDYLHIADFAQVIGRSKQSTRHLIEDGNSVRRLKAFRDRSRLMIPLTELVGYPFVNQGHQLTGRDVYHYTPYRQTKEGPVVVATKDALAVAGTKADANIEWKRELCTECTYSGGCIARAIADGLEVPKGDD